jgi:hypothetical protein
MISLGLDGPGFQKAWVWGRHRVQPGADLQDNVIVIGGRPLEFRVKDASHCVLLLCRSFLEKMAAYAAAQGPLQLAHSSSSSSSSNSSSVRPSAYVIPVYVAPTYQVPEQQQQQAVVHETVGYIQVPMQASAQQVYQLIQVSWKNMCRLMKHNCLCC